jgi:NitT/TauT family transport system substrate-binding protein
MFTTETRRRFLTTLSSAGAAGFIGGPNSLAQDGRLETTSVRFGQDPSICLAPQIVASELLRADGFTDVR